jgi:hypothetical protein
MTIPFFIFLEFVFHAFIFPSTQHLGSYGIIHNGMWIWLQQAWEGLRVCWDILAEAVLRNGRVLVRFGEAVLEMVEELARVFGARQRDVELAEVGNVESVVEEAGDQHGDQIPLGSMRSRGASPQASHPPPPYDVSMHCINCTPVLIVTLA